MLIVKFDLQNGIVLSLIQKLMAMICVKNGKLLDINGKIVPNNVCILILAIIVVVLVT